MNNSTLNKLRAAVLGANDGTVSISVLLISIVTVLPVDKILLIGIATLLGGALSMSIGEYISVSAQKDAELNAQLEDFTNPVEAAVYSFLSFAIGASIPLVAVLAVPEIWVAIIAVLVALDLTAVLSSKVSGGSMKLSLLRNLAGGLIAIIIGLILNVLFSV